MKKKIELEQTKEYDINAILEKAREEKEVNYEKERLKKVRDTQYDILKNLDFEEEKELEPKASDSKTKDELLELINTITENELQKTKLDPLDILSDLKGDENTMVLGAKEDLEESMKIFENEKETKSYETKEEPKNQKEDDSFYTGNLSFSDSDFDDFDDLKNDISSNRTMLIIIIVILILLAIAGTVIFINSSLN